MEAFIEQPCRADLFISLNRKLETMNPLREVTGREVPSSSYSHESSSGSNRPQPADTRHESQPSPFLKKTYDLVDDPSTDQVISWSQETTTTSSSSSSFVIWDPRTFSLSILPKYFKHNNFSNFIRQLNSYVSPSCFPMLRCHCFDYCAIIYIPLPN